jgi:hypothetical protein
MSEDCYGNTLILYGYSILEYSRKYDAEWIEALQQLQLILGVISVQKENYKRSMQKITRKYIPDENIYQIMAFLDYKDLLKISEVSKLWFELANRDELWKNLLRDRFSVTPETIQVKANQKLYIPPKLIYKEMLFAYKNLLLKMCTAQYVDLPAIPLNVLQYITV